MWEPLGWTPFISGHFTDENSISKNDYEVPFTVLNTAYIESMSSRSLEIFWKTFDSTNGYFLYFHFMELEKLQANQSRQFNISINGKLVYGRNGPVVPKYLTQTTIYSTEAMRFEGKLEIWLNSTGNSTLPPLINAMEVYNVKNFTGQETNQNDGIHLHKEIYCS